MTHVHNDRFREAVRHYNGGRLEAAASACRGLLDADPAHAGAARMLAAILERAGRPAEGVGILRRALQAHPEDGALRYALGRVLARDGHFEEAVIQLRHAGRLHPDNPLIPVSLGYCLARSGHPDEAAEHYRRALKLKPNDAAVHRAFGEVLTRLTRFDESIAAYREAAALDPRDAAACARLAALYERTNRLEEMQGALVEGLRRQPRDPGLAFQQAVYLRRAVEPDKALERLDALDRQQQPPDLARRVAFERARVLDSLGRYDEAFEQAARGNRLTRQMAERAGHDTGAYAGWLKRIHDTFSESWRDARPARDAAGGGGPVFIFGFPRSGTTLIDAVLAVREEFQVYEERGFLGALFRALERHGLSYPECGANLDAAVIDDLRRSYLQAAERSAPRRPGTVLVDKDPLLTPAIPLLQQVFPGAKYVFALRHPLDVCLSCHMYGFSPDSALADFSGIDELASVYADSMRIWMLARRHLPLDVLELRYESLVEDFEAGSRELFQFLGTPWDPTVLDFADRARRRHTPILRNHDRIIQGIYTDSRARWKRYEKHLAPALPLVEDAMRTFRYQC